MSFPTIPSRIVAAPMAGGPTTPELVAAVGEAGGLGMLAAGYKTAAAVHADIERVRELSQKPFGVNVFVPTRPNTDPAVEAYRTALAQRAARWGIEPGPATHTDDDWAAKIDLLLAVRPAVASFAFGLPDSGIVTRLQDAGISVWITITAPVEAARAASADALVVQGWEAGAHRGGLADADDEQLGLLPLLRLTRRETDLPLVAAGGLADGAGIAAVLVAGAQAAMLGTAFLRCPEAGTSAPHLSALGSDRGSVVTRAFTGRRARALRNGFVDAAPDAPAAYPEIHYVTAPIRAAARAAGDPEDINLWAGQAHRLARSLPAGELVETLAAECRAAASSF